MMRPVARFVTRLQGEDDGLFVGIVTFTGRERGHFKPNTVYEIRDIMGALTIVEVGQGVGAGSENCASSSMADGKTWFHWAMDIGDIIRCHGKRMFLTLKEARSLRGTTHSDNNGD